MFLQEQNLIALAKGLMRRYEKPIKDALSANRILIVSPFPDIVFKYHIKLFLTVTIHV